MNNAPVFALLTFFAIPVATSQCAIQPIKPIPPIGCKAGNVDSNAREMLTKARDAAAAHLTPEVLLETQKRARQWLEAHSSALSN